MPRLPRGLTKRKTRAGGKDNTVYVWRSWEGGRDVRVSLGSDYSVALAEFDRLTRKKLLTENVENTITVEAFSGRWLTEYCATRRVPRGRAQAEQRFRDYLWPVLGRMRLSEIKAADIRRLNAELTTQGLGLISRRRLLEDFRCVLRYAVEEAEVL